VNDQPTSGNRWEPTPGEAPASEQPAAEPPVNQQPVHASPATVEAAQPAGGFGARVRGAGRATGVRIGAAAIVVFVIGGAGGFGLAHLVSQDRASSSVTDPRDGLPDGDHGHGFHGPRGTPPGQAPQEGTPGDDSGTSDDGLAGGGGDT
jgi:hypothetical protein